MRGMNQPVPLQFPEDDARAFGSVLKASGYEVDILLGRQARPPISDRNVRSVGSVEECWRWESHAVG